MIARAAKAEIPPDGAAVTRSRSRAVAAGLLAALVVFPALAAMLTAFVRGSGPPLLVAMPAVILAYACVRLVQHSLSGRQTWMNLTFWVFVYVWLGVAPLLQLAFVSFPWPDVYAAPTIVLAGAIVIVGLISFDIGATVRIFRTRAGRPAHAARSSTPRLLSTPRLMMLAIASLAIAAVLIQVVGIDAFLLPRSQFNARLHGSYPQPVALAIIALLRAPGYVSLLFMTPLVVGTFRSPRGRSTPLLWALYAAVLVLNVVVSNPIVAPRYWFGFCVLALAVTIVRWRPTVSFAGWATALIGVFLVVFPYTDVFRYSLDARLTDLLGDRTLVEEIVHNGDYDAFQQIANTVEYVSERGHTWGRQIATAALFWVPRSLWQGKGLGTGELVAEAAGYDFVNLSLPLWGELYIDGSFVLVAFGMFAWGRLARLLEQGPIVHRGPISRRAAFLALLGAYQIFLLRGELLSAVAYLAPVAICTWFLFAGPRARSWKSTPCVRYPDRR